jgi:hypothetical protein
MSNFKNIADSMNDSNNPFMSFDDGLVNMNDDLSSMKTDSPEFEYDNFVPSTTADFSNGGKPEECSHYGY